MKGGDRNFEIGVTNFSSLLSLQTESFILN